MQIRPLSNRLLGPIGAEQLDQLTRTLDEPTISNSGCIPTGQNTVGYHSPAGEVPPIRNKPVYEAEWAVPERRISDPVQYGPAPGRDPGAHNCAPATWGSRPWLSRKLTVQYTAFELMSGARTMLDLESESDVICGWPLTTVVVVVDVLVVVGNGVAAISRWTVSPFP